MDNDPQDGANVLSIQPSEAAQREVDELFARLAKLGRAYRLATAQAVATGTLIQHADSLVGAAQGDLPKIDG